jgi:hypothetical protein
MVALPPAIGIAKIIVKQQLASVNVFNVLHAQTADLSPWTPAGLNALASAVRGAWVAQVIPLQSNQISLSDVQCVDLSSDTGADATATGSNVGAVPGAALTANAAICWSWKISRRYRGGHPRTYIGGIGGSQVTNANTIAPSVVTSHQAAAVAVRAAINGVTTSTGTALMCVVHYTRAKLILPVPLISLVNSVSVDTRIDSQRRRLGRDRS